MPGLPYLAALRVYEPVEALGPEFADRLQRPDAPESDPSLAPILEREAALRRAIAVPPRLVPDTDDDDLLIIEVDGRQFGAPTRVGLRCRLAMEDLRNNTADPLLDAFSRGRFWIKKSGISRHGVQKIRPSFHTFDQSRGRSRFRGSSRSHRENVNTFTKSPGHVCATGRA